MPGVTPGEESVDTAAVAHPLGGRRAWAVWGSALLVYMLAVFHRSSLGVAGVLAAERFDITSAQLATFTMVQLLVYAAMQVPVGAMLDRYGSRALLTTGLVMMTAAQAGFAFAHSFGAGVLARIFVGMGDAMVFVSVLRLVALWFPPGRSAIVTQATGWAGQLGAILAAGPLAAALGSYGWRNSFLVSAAVGVVVAVVLLAVVRDTPYLDAQRTTMRMRAVARALRSAWRSPGTQLGLWCHFTAQFSVTVFAMIWGFPYLTVGLGMSRGAASALLMVMVLTGILSSLFVGSLVTRFPYSRSSLVLAIVLAIVGMWTLVLAWPGHPPMALVVMLGVTMSVGGPGSMVGFDLARTFNPPERIGSATGIVNVGGFTASLCTVVLIGMVIDHLSPGGPSTWSNDSFRVAWCVQYPVWLLGIVQILRLRQRARAEIDADPDMAHLRRRISRRRPVA
ncbi:MFS transporter [Yimella sp. cx-51]|nr:MFS transporter [Yimella sp. cx-51]QTH38480.1 MFS transporter [Yimella sp. cx-51]